DHPSSQIATAANAAPNGDGGSASTPTLTASDLDDLPPCLAYPPQLHANPSSSLAPLRYSPFYCRTAKPTADYVPSGRGRSSGRYRHRADHYRADGSRRYCPWPAHAMKVSGGTPSATRLHRLLKRRSLP